MFCKLEWKRQRRKDPAYKDRENELQTIRRLKGISENQRLKSIARAAKYRKENSGKVIANTTKRKIHIRMRTPRWLTPIDFERMQNEYRLATLLSKVTGSPWEVDHIYPLLGKNVSGFHVPNNLQAIKKLDNLAKSNKFEVA
jgi:hypothetical protein